MSDEPVALVAKAHGGAGGGGRRVVGPPRAPFGLFIAREARFVAHEAPKATITPFASWEQTSSSRNQAERRCQTVRRQGVSYPRVSPASKSCLGGAGREGRDAGFRRVLGSKPGLRFCRFGRGFAVISGYFWLFLAISGLGASPGGPGSKLIILRATGESQETVLLTMDPRL